MVIILIVTTIILAILKGLGIITVSWWVVGLPVFILATIMLLAMLAMFCGGVIFFTILKKFLGQ